MNSIKHILRMHHDKEYVDILSEEPDIVIPPNRILEYIRNKISKYYNSLSGVKIEIWKLQLSESFQFIKDSEVKVITLPNEPGFKEEDLDKLLDQADEYIEWFFK